MNNATYIVNTNHPFLKCGILLKSKDDLTYFYSYLDSDNNKKKYIISIRDILFWLKEQWIFVKRNNGKKYNYKYSMDQIAKAVCDTLNINLDLMVALNKKQESALPRQLFTYFSKKLMPEYSYVEISLFLRPEYPFNHGTLVYGKKKIESLLKHDKEIKKFVSIINEKLKL